MGDSAAYVADSEYDVVGTDVGGLETDRVSVSVYLYSGWSVGDW